MEKNYKGNLLSLKLKDGLKGIEIVLSKVDAVLMQNVQKALSEGSKSFGHNIVQSIKRTIMYGGSAGAKWTYWKRKRGRNTEFQAITTSSPRKVFSWRFRYNGANELTLPIHPSSYKRYRKVRRFPARGEFAMTDSGNSYKNVLVRASMNTRTKMVTINVFSKSKKYADRLIKNDIGWKVNGQQVIRQTITPAFLTSKKYIALNLNSAMKQTTKDLESLSKQQKDK